LHGVAQGLAETEAVVAVALKERIEILRSVEAVGRSGADEKHAGEAAGVGEGKLSRDRRPERVSYENGPVEA